MKKSMKWLLLLILLIIITIITIEIKIVGIFRWDEIIANYVALLRADYLTYIFMIITNLASAVILALICVFMYILIKNKKFALFSLLNLINIFLLNLLLKNIFIRERPGILPLIKETGYSYPSGHAMMSFGFYGFLIYLIYNSKCETKKKKSLIVLISGIIFLIGFSRIYLGVHYASDIIVGFLISLIYLVIYITLIDKEFKRN